MKRLLFSVSLATTLMFSVPASADQVLVSTGGPAPPSGLQKPVSSVQELLRKESDVQMAIRFSPDDEKFKKLVERAEKSKSADDYFKISLLYFHGITPLTRDEQDKRGMEYLNKGLTLNPKSSYGYFIKGKELQRMSLNALETSAELGDGVAKKEVSFDYFNSVACRSDEKQAILWLELYKEMHP